MALALAQNVVTYTASGVAYAVPRIYSAIVYTLPHLYNGTSAVASSIASGASYAAPGVSSAVQSLPLVVTLVAITALSCACCVVGVKSGAFKASLSLAKGAGKLAVKTAKVVPKVGKATVKAGKGAAKTTLKTAAAGAKITSKVVRPTWTVRDILANAGCIAYISYQAATLSQEVLLGAITGIFIRSLEYKLNWNQWTINNPEAQWGEFSFTHSHDLVQQLPLFERNHLIGMPRKILAFGAAYAAVECVRGNWIAHPASPYAAGAVLGYQLTSFALNFHWDCLKSAIKVIESRAK